MYIHLGKDISVPEADVMGIFDLDNTTGSRTTRDFLGNAQKRGLIVNVADDLPKSFIICGYGDNLRVYLSQLSPSTLNRRSGSFPF